MKKLFRLGGGEWRENASRAWWRKYPAWAIMALLVVVFLLWMALHKGT
jgi:hypothetical protein